MSRGRPRSSSSCFGSAFFIAAFSLAYASGCFTQPRLAADSALTDKDADLARKLAPEELDIIRAQNRYIFYHESAVTDLGVVADVGVIADLDGYLYRFYAKDKSVLPPGTAREDEFGKILAAKGSRYLHIEASKARVERNRLIIHYLRQQTAADADRRGFHYPPVANIETSLALYETILEIEEAWLTALQNGAPLAKAKRDRTKSHAALIKTIADWRTALPPPDQNAPPQISEAEDAAALEQLVAAKEWLAVSLDEKADEEDMRLAQAIALSFGIELWDCYHDSRIPDREFHPLEYYIVRGYPWGGNGGYTHQKLRKGSDAAP